MKRVMKMNLIASLKTSLDFRPNIKINISLLLIIITAMLWGTSGIAAKYLIDLYDMSPLTIGGMRVIIGAPILLVTVKVQMKEKKEKVNIDKKHYTVFGIYGICIAMFQITFFSAVKISMVSIVTLIALCTAPVFVAILSRIFLSEKITKRVVTSMAISTVGTVLIMGTNGSGTGEVSQYLGYLLALGAGLSYATITICGKKLVKNYEPVNILSIVFILASIILLPLVKIPSNLSVTGWLILLYLGVVPTAIAYVLFNVGLKKASATKAAIATLFEPLTATVLSVILIGERFSQVQGIGASLLIVALVLIVVKKEEEITELSS